MGAMLCGAKDKEEKNERNPDNRDQACQIKQPGFMTSDPIQDIVYSDQERCSLHSAGRGIDLLLKLARILWVSCTPLQSSAYASDP
jgi:hypothetical protein